MRPCAHTEVTQRSRDLKRSPNAQKENLKAVKHQTKNVENIQCLWDVVAAAGVDVYSGAGSGLDVTPTGSEQTNLNMVWSEI